MRFLRNVSYFLRNFGLLGLIRMIQARATGSERIITIKHPAVRFPIHLRCGTSDLRTFKQVFGNKEYEFSPASEPVSIIDAGANIGLASLYFANRFPCAKIIAIEPEISNYEILAANVAPYENVVVLNTALWDSAEVINVCDPGLGKWGFTTRGNSLESENKFKICHKIQGVTVRKIRFIRFEDTFDIRRGHSAFPGFV